MAHGFPSSGFPFLFLLFPIYWALFPHIMNVAARVCRSPDSWPWTDHSQISLIHSPTPPKCSTRAIVALINNLGIVYHQYCSSSESHRITDTGWKEASSSMSAAC
jgi:hypothetical protein